MVLLEDRTALINTVIWYRDNYFKNRFGMLEACNDIIRHVNSATTPEQLEIWQKHVDGWID